MNINKSIVTAHEFPDLSALLTEVFDNALVAIIIADMVPVIKYVNHEFTRLFGYTREDAIGKRISELISVDVNSVKLKDVKKEIDSGKRVEYETVRRTKGGRIIPVYARIAPIIINGIKVGGYSFYNDISKIKEAQDALQKANQELETRFEERTKALKESEAKYRKTIESSHDGVAILQKDKHIYVNNSFAKIFGYNSPDEVIGKNAIELIHPHDLEYIRKRGEKRLKGEIGGERYEHRGIKKNGEIIYVEVSVTKIIHDGNPATLVFTRDISERKEAETKLEKAYSEIKEAQSRIIQQEKMASIGQLAAGVAHEINNPTGFVSSNLNTLSVYIKDYNILLKKYRKLIKILEQEGIISSYTNQFNDIKSIEDKIDIDFRMEDVSSLIQESCEGTDRIKKIVQDLKDFAHPGEDKPSYADINKCIESTLNVVWNEIKYKAQVVKDYGALPEILCFPQQLNQVFANLFVNAAQAISDEGEIRIKTGLSGEEIEVIISDTGMGIPEENLSKIFEPFFTTKEVGKGTGLGLNVAYNIIEKHNGKISVESKQGQGTMFTIILPVNNTEESLIINN
ncbi:MAG: PAS domain S-box protein [Deltaproteobacteria bacterium]|nr:PAS domain S-box protein [Deltaproteobacteria bacterium]